MAEFTLFIDNLPQIINSQELRRFFSIHGQVADAYVPHFQRKRRHGRFGFIGVKSREQGDRLITEADGRRCGNQRIRVQWAKYPKNSRQSRISREQCWTWTKGCNHNQVFHRGQWRPQYQAKVTKMSEEFIQQNKTAKVLNLEKVDENLEWLERSLTCISDVPRDVDALSIEIQDAFPDKILVRDLGKFKFLLTVETKEVKEKLKTEGAECLKQWFSSFSDWVEEDACKTRRLWLEMVGIPIHIWSDQNIKRIAENWGDVVSIEKDTSNLTSFASAKVVIDSLCMSPIEDEAVIQVGHVGYRISVFEAKTEITIFHMGSVDKDRSPSMKINCTQRKEDEGSSGDVEAQADLAYKDWQRQLSHADEQKGREGEQSPDGRSILNSNSKSANEIGQSRLSPEGSINLLSHTKTASFSQKGVTEEAIKSRLKNSLDDGAVYSSYKSINDGTAILKSAEQGPKPNKDNCLSTPDVENERSESLGPPPGFEDCGAAEHVKKKPITKQSGMEKRITRSQKKLGESNSQITSESMRKLAEESLEIGRILGLKVIAKEEIAKRNIIDSLKEAKRRRSKQNKT